LWKNKKIWFLLVPFGKFQEKFRKKEKSGLSACLWVLSIVLRFHLVALRLDTS
jgi:hypothetical protein